MNLKRKKLVRAKCIKFLEQTKYQPIILDIINKIEIFKIVAKM